VGITTEATSSSKSTVWSVVRFTCHVIWLYEYIIFIFCYNGGTLYTVL